MLSVIGVAAVAALIAIEVASSGSSAAPPRPAPQLPTQVLNPPRVRLADLRGRPALINFWASWCHSCREEAPEMERLARALHGRATLVGVDWSDDLGNAREFIREHDWTFPVLRDSGEVGDEYGIRGLPTTFVLDTRGRIVETLPGPQTRSSLEAALRSVESEHPPSSAAASPPRRFKARVHLTPVAGTRIAWYERGRGTPLVMLTGTGSTMSEWDPALVRLLARDHRLILFDYPGVGMSGSWQGRSFESLATATAGLMSAIGLPRAEVLGWSMGGFVAQRLAIAHAGRVADLVLAGTNPGGPQTVLGTARAQAIDSKPDPPLAEIMRELYPPDRQAQGRRFLRRLARAARTGEIPDDFHVAAATTRSQVAAEDPWLRSDMNYQRLAAVRAPTLAAAGASDPVVPPINLRRIAGRIPGARFEVFPGAHAFLFEDRDRFARAVDHIPEA